MKRMIPVFVFAILLFPGDRYVFAQELTPWRLAQIGANTAQQVPEGRDSTEWVSAREAIQTIAQRLMESPAPVPRAVVELVDSTDDNMNSESFPGVLSGSGPFCGYARRDSEG
jgi:hypothetical protein